MPTVEFYNDTGTAIGSVTASSVGAGGSSVVINTPACLVSQFSGSYVATISNRNVGGTSTVAAAAAIDVYGNDPPPQCDPTGKMQNSCAGRYGFFWDPETCSCQPI